MSPTHIMLNKAGFKIGFTKYMFMSHDQTAGQMHHVKVANKFLRKSGKVQLFRNDDNKIKITSAKKLRGD
jgi:ribosomal protein S4E